MADLETLKGLLARVQAAKAPDRRLWCEAVVAILDEGAAFDEMTLRLGRVMLAHDKLAVAVGSADGTASIDAAVALVGHVLPKWSLQLGMSEGLKHPAVVMGRSYPTNLRIAVEHRTAPLAICAALLSALIAQAEQGGSHGE